MPRLVSGPVLSMYSTSYPLTVVEAAGVAAVRRCVTLIANSIARSPWGEWDGVNAVTPPNRLVERPASLMSRREWTWRVVSQMALDDLAYLYMVGGVDDDGVPGSLLPLPREAIAPAGFIDPWGVFPPTSYSIAGVPGTVSGEYVIPVRSAFWPGVPLHLQGILQMARATMLSGWASENYASKYWQSGGSPTTVITTDQELTDGQAASLGKRWQERRALGPDYPAVLGKGGHADPYGIDAANAVATEARREITLEIGNLFGVNGRYLNVSPQGNSQTYANLNDESLSLERFTLSGFVSPIEDVITSLIPNEMRIDLSKITSAGQESRFRAWSSALGQKAWLEPDEVREREGYPPNPKLNEAQEAAREVALAQRAAGQGVEPEPEQEPANAE